MNSMRAKRSRSERILTSGKSEWVRNMNAVITKIFTIKWFLASPRRRKQMERSDQGGKSAEASEFCEDCTNPATSASEEPPNQKNRRRPLTWRMLPERGWIGLLQLQESLYAK
jgi:hypothetical protein